jgi:hypothetical protein
MRQSYSLPDDQCERLKRSEMNGVRMLLAHLSTASYCQDDLKNRLECVPDWNRRFRLAVGGLKAVCDDVVGTISRNQAKQLLGTLRDYELRLVPKATPGTVNIMLTKEQGMELMDLARERCLSCTEDGDSCRKCRLYKILEATTPMDDYGSGLICPYALAEWE